MMNYKNYGFVQIRTFVKRKYVIGDVMKNTKTMDTIQEQQVIAQTVKADATKMTIVVRWNVEANIVAGGKKEHVV